MSDKNGGNIIVKVTKYGDNEIGDRLHPDYEYRFKSILGNIYCLGNGMRFLNNDAFPTSLLNKRLNNKDFKRIVKNKDTKFIPNYWELVKLLTADRLLSDKHLLDDINEKYGDKIDNVTFKPMLRLSQGIVDEEINNDKLFIYGKILDKLLRLIIKTYRKYLEDKDTTTIVEIDKVTFKRLKQDIKEVVIADAIKRADGSDLATSVSTTTDDELKNKFMG